MDKNIKWQQGFSIIFTYILPQANQNYSQEVHFAQEIHDLIGIDKLTRFSLQSHPEQYHAI